MISGLEPYHNVAYNQPWFRPEGFPPKVHDFQRDLMFLLHDVARLMRVDADKRARAHGFRGRMRTRAGRLTIKRRRRKGRSRLTV